MMDKPIMFVSTGGGAFCFGAGARLSRVLHKVMEKVESHINGHALEVFRMSAIHVTELSASGVPGYRISFTARDSRMRSPVVVSFELRAEQLYKMSMVDVENFLTDMAIRFVNAISRELFLQDRAAGLGEEPFDTVTDASPFWTTGGVKKTVKKDGERAITIRCIRFRRKGGNTGR